MIECHQNLRMNSGFLFFKRFSELEYQKFVKVIAAIYKPIIAFIKKVKYNYKKNLIFFTLGAVTMGLILKYIQVHNYITTHSGIYVENLD